MTCGVDGDDGGGGERGYVQQVLFVTSLVRFDVATFNFFSLPQNQARGSVLITYF